jgi:hypothetical protein
MNWDPENQCDWDEIEASKTRLGRLMFNVNDAILWWLYIHLGDLLLKTYIPHSSAAEHCARQWPSLLWFVRGLDPLHGWFRPTYRQWLMYDPYAGAPR